MLDRSGVQRWISDRAKPLPTYGAGAWSRRPARVPFRRTVGSLFPQPDRLDDRLGRGWSVVASTPAATTAWRKAGLHVVEHPHAREWSLLRPDRYVFACGDIPHALAALRATVGPGLRTEHPGVATSGDGAPPDSLQQFPTKKGH